MRIYYFVCNIYRLNICDDNPTRKRRSEWSYIKVIIYHWSQVIINLKIYTVSKRAKAKKILEKYLKTLKRIKML